MAHYQRVTSFQDWHTPKGQPTQAPGNKQTTMFQPEKNVKIATVIIINKPGASRFSQSPFKSKNIQNIIFLIGNFSIFTFNFKLNLLKHLYINKSVFILTSLHQCRCKFCQHQRLPCCFRLSYFTSLYFQVLQVYPVNVA